jgi:voltage-gated sodium channel
MRAVPEMMVIIKGMVASTRSVLCTGFLLMLVLYTFCILFTDAYHERTYPEGVEGGEEEDMFGTMGKSMFSLFIMGTVLDDVTAAANVIRATDKKDPMMTAFIIFILISSFMMLNMLIGVLVEVVGATAEGEREKAIETNVREAIAQIFNSMDKDSNREISRGEFLAM